MRPRGDATSRPVTRYVGQCGRHNPHDTHDELGLVEAEWPAAAHSGSRPRANLPAGSNASFTRCINAAFGELHAEAVDARAARFRSSQPPWSRAAARAPVSTVASSPATWIVPTPISAAHPRARHSVERTTHGRQPARGHRDPAAVFADRERGRSAGGQPGRLRVDIGRDSFEQHVSCLSVPEHRRGAVEVGWVVAAIPTRRISGRGRHRKVSCTSTPSVPNEPTMRRGRS